MTIAQTYQPHSRMICMIIICISMEGGHLASGRDLYNHHLYNLYNHHPYIKGGWSVVVISSQRILSQQVIAQATLLLTGN